MIPTFFEGPEKKVELAVAASHPSLRAKGEGFWREVVEASRAQVLSVIRNEHCDAYLLSESSLFVYDGFLTMITCGRTRLVDAVERILGGVRPRDVTLLIYERKNEHWPERQPTTFFEDAGRLATWLPGRALRFGDEHDHHVHVFHSERPFTPDGQDTTLEILMHGLPPDAASRFVGCKAPAGRTIAAARGIDSILPGYQLDEHPFTPAGYSMNGLSDESYYTIHVTPEAIGSYVSFETNVDYRGRLEPLLERVLKVFRPRSFDVVAFAPEGSLADEVGPAGYRIKDRVRTSFSGYDVGFWHCYQPLERRAPVVLPLG